MAAASRAVLVGVLAAACLSALAPPAIARLSPSTEPSSPCPQVFRYEPNPSAASGWSAVIRLLAPSKFSALHLSLLLAASEHLPEEPAPGSLTLRGGVSAARALVRAAHQGRRKAVEYDVQFSCAVTAAPTLLNLTVNGRVFCAAMQEPAFSPSTITLVADLETGLDWASAGDAEFGVLPDDSRLAEEYSLHLGPEAAAAAVPPCGPAAPPLQPLQPAQPAQPPLEQHMQHAVPPTGDIYAAQNVPHHHMFVLPSLNPSYHYQSDKGYNGQIPPRESYSATPVSAAPTPPPPGVYMPPAPEVYTVPPTTSTPKNPEMYKPPPNAEPTPPPRPPPPQTPASPYDAPPPPIPSDRTPLLEEDCGRAWSSAANPLVTRGAAAVRGRWPWLVALFKKLGRRDQLGLNFECGASLVSRKHVVTAAHCVEVRGRRRRPVDASLLVVYLGKHDLLSYTEPGQQTAEVDSVRMHPDYASGRSETTPATPTSSSGSTSAYDNDIALLVLTERVEPTKHIRPVCLWDAALAGTNLDDVVGKVGAVPGWGKDDTGAISNEIRVANMPIVSQETCLRSNVFYHTFTNKNTFCAGFRNGTSVCNGDSGGGLFVKDPDGRWRIRGIVSVSMFSVNDQSCDAYNYAVFTDVAKYLPWLFENMYSTWDSR